MQPHVHVSQYGTAVKQNQAKQIKKTWNRLDQNSWPSGVSSHAESCLNYVLQRNFTAEQRSNRTEISFFRLRNEVNLHDSLFSLVVLICICWLHRSQETGRLQLIRWLFNAGILTHRWFHLAVWRTCKGWERSCRGSALRPTHLQSAFTTLLLCSGNPSLRTTAWLTETDIARCYWLLTVWQWTPVGCEEIALRPPSLTGLS